MTSGPPAARGDLVGAVAFLLLALAGVVQSLRLSLGGWHNPGPGLFPLVLSAVLGGLAVALVVVAVGRRGRPAEAPPPEAPSAGATPRSAWWALVSLLAFYALLEPLGFLATSVLLLVVLLRAIARQRWPVTLAVSVGASLSSYLLFDRLLQLPLPRGVIGF